MPLNRNRFKAPSTVFIVLKQAQKICFIHRTNTGWMDDWYSVPAGGVEAGETLRAAAVREAREEVGVEMLEQDVQLALTLHCKIEHQSWLGHFFVVNSWRGEPRALELEKHSHCCWSLLEDINTQVVPYVRLALEALLRDENHLEFGWADHMQEVEPPDETYV
jgi:8-oxo-dGTP diphosphatase